MSDAIFFTDSSGGIYWANLTTNTVFQIADVGFTLYDIDFDNSGNLWGLDSGGSLYFIDLYNGYYLQQGSLPNSANALEISGSYSYDTLFFHAGNSSSTVSISFSGYSVDFAYMNSNTNSSGDIQVFGTSLYTSADNGYVYKYDIYSGAFQAAYDTNDSYIYGMAQVDAGLVLLSSDGDVKITDANLNTISTLSLGYSVYGAATAPSNLTYGWHFGQLITNGWHWDSGWYAGWGYGWFNAGWDYGWSYGWHYNWFYGYYVGWGVGWYYEGWTVGWNYGWKYGWHAEFGWHIGWGYQIGWFGY